MKRLDGLYAELLTIESVDQERIKGFADRDRLVLQRAIPELRRGIRLVENLFTGALRSRFSPGSP